MTFINDAPMGPMHSREQALLCATHANRGRRVLSYSVIPNGDRTDEERARGRSGPGQQPSTAAGRRGTQTPKHRRNRGTRQCSGGPMSAQNEHSAGEGRV